MTLREDLYLRCFKMVEPYLQTTTNDSFQVVLTAAKEMSCLQRGGEI